MENENLGLKTFKGVLWNVFGRVSNQGMSFIMGIILARIIAPESYGLIAMALVVVAITGSIVDGGFGAALIRKKNPAANDYYTVFWFNIITAIFLYLIIYFAAPAIEKFYDTEGLVPVIRYLSLTVIISGFTTVQNVQLTKKLDFSALNIIALVATIISGGLGIAMAYGGYGVWALVAQQLSSNMLNSIMILFYNRWMPSWIFSRKSFNELFAFSRNMFASAVLNSVFQNIYPLIIGKWFAPAMLAYYTRAESYQRLLARNLTSVVQTVSFPSLATLQDDNYRLKNAYRQMIRMLMLVNAPIMLGLIVVAEPLIIFMITDTWLPTVPYLQLLCLAGLLYPLHAVNLNVIKVKGRSDIFLKLEMVKKILIVLAIFSGLPWGITGLVVAKVVASFIAYFLNAYFSLKLIGYKVKEQLQDVLAYVMLACIMALGVWSLSFWITEAPAMLLFTQIITGVGLYLAGCFGLKLKAFFKLIDMLKKVLKKEK